MNYYEFKKQYSGQGVFSLNSIERSSDNSLSSNLRRWKGEEKILRIRQGWYLARPTSAWSMSSRGTK